MVELASPKFLAFVSNKIKDLLFLQFSLKIIFKFYYVFLQMFYSFKQYFLR